LFTVYAILRYLSAGALLLGDAFNMRHPLTGGGMTVALSDTRLLCEMLQPLPSFEDAIATARSTAEFYTKRKPVSATINTLANALYKVGMLLLLRFGGCWDCCVLLFAMRVLDFPNQRGHQQLMAYSHARYRQLDLGATGITR
jgi:hypothetical protein